jgi:hypothetical protein
MNLKPWLIAALMVVFLGLGAGATLGVIHLTRTPNSCGISCPNQTAYPNAQGGVACPTKTAPLCQCTDASKPIAACIPLP